MQERRAFQIELRATRGFPRRLEGYAATFGAEARVADFIETIKPGAFSASINSGADILALADHDPTRVLGRTRSATLRLSEDSKGLAFDLSLPDTQAAHDVLALADRGDLGGMSFGFVATDERWTGNRRELRSVDLFEISVVSAWPAYPDTTITARSRPSAAQRLSLARRYLSLPRGRNDDP
jgi:HK97 family phage prohead protease